MAQDICSVIACHDAFEECKDGEVFDLRMSLAAIFHSNDQSTALNIYLSTEAVWPLVGLSTWFIAFLEGLMKDCVLWSDGSTVPAAPPPAQSPASDDLFGAPCTCILYLRRSASVLTTHLSHTAPAPFSTTTTSLPVTFLHLIHPFALSNVRTALADIKSFYAQLVKLNPHAENVQIAKSALLDVVACSGINLDELDSVLSQVPDEIKRFDGTVSYPFTRTDSHWELKYSLTGKELANSFSLCRPSQALFPLVDTVVTKLMGSGAIDKPRLFIKSSDLVIGVAKLALSDSEKDSNRDIVSKGLLLRRGRSRVCQRCGGKSELQVQAEMKHVSLRWRAWENKWLTRCICGGYWESRSTPNYGM